MKIPTSAAQIRLEIEGLKRGGVNAGAYYGSLLRIVIAPSLFVIDQETVGMILDTLRDNEGNPTAMKVQDMLQALSPLGFIRPETQRK